MSWPPMGPAPMPQMDSQPQYAQAPWEQAQPTLEEQLAMLQSSGSALAPAHPSATAPVMPPGMQQTMEYRPPEGTAMGPNGELIIPPGGNPADARQTMEYRPPAGSTMNPDGTVTVPGPQPQPDQYGMMPWMQPASATLGDATTAHAPTATTPPAEAAPTEAKPADSLFSRGLNAAGDFLKSAQPAEKYGALGNLAPTNQDLELAQTAGPAGDEARNRIQFADAALAADQQAKDADLYTTAVAAEAEANMRAQQAAAVKRQQVREKYAADLEHTMSNVRNGSVRPNAFFADMSTGDRFGHAAMLFMSGFTSAVKGGDNVLLEQMMGLVDRDIDAQKANIANEYAKLNAIQGAQDRELGAIETAEHDSKVAGIAKLEYLRTKISASAAKSANNVPLQQRAAMLDQAMRERQAQLAAEAEQKAFDVGQARELQAARIRKAQLEGDALAAKAAGGSGSGGPVGGAPPERLTELGLDPKQQESVAVMGSLDKYGPGEWQKAVDDGVVVVARNPAARKELEDKMSAGRQVMMAMRELAASARGQSLSGMDGATGDIVQKAQQVRQSMIQFYGGNLKLADAAIGALYGGAVTENGIAKSIIGKFTGVGTGTDLADDVSSGGKWFNEALRADYTRLTGGRELKTTAWEDTIPAPKKSAEELAVEDAVGALEQVRNPGKLDPGGKDIKAATQTAIGTFLSVLPPSDTRANWRIRTPNGSLKAATSPAAVKAELAKNLEVIRAGLAKHTNVAERSALWAAAKRAHDAAVATVTSYKTPSPQASAQQQLEAPFKGQTLGERSKSWGK